RAAAGQDPGAAQAAIGFRRGSRGRRAPAGPPPLLEGQAAPVRKAVTEPAAAAKADADAPAAGAESKRARPARKAAAASRSQPADTPEKKAATAPAKQAGSAPAKKAASGPAKKAAARGTPADGKFDPREFGLPVEAGDVASYIARTYKGVGPKSVQALLERFGAAHVFEALQTRPDDVREVMGPGRGERLLEAWSRDIGERRAGANGGDGDVPPEDAAAGRTRGSRGGRRTRRGRTGNK
ncbi:MAG TPA: hypothetical protein VK936_01245, partial [Longimicrobiales bacterium]|nr:hypothetical protein [Longimicrobiales bacterium]